MTGANMHSPFLGRVAVLKTTQKEHRGKVHTQYELDDPVLLQELKDAYPTFRIWLPGTIGTMDFRPSRTNVRIDESGIIIQVYRG